LIVSGLMTSPELQLRIETDLDGVEIIDVDHLVLAFARG